MKTKVIVNEGVIRGLVNDPKAREKFSFIKHAHRLLKPTKRTCCGRRARSALNTRTVKTTILGMEEKELARLKQHLGAEKLVFYMTSRTGGITHLER